MIDESVIEESKCYVCLGISLADAIKIVMLKRIVDGGGAGGGVYVTSGVGPPVAAPGVSSAIYFDENDGTQYNYYSGAWH